MNEVQSAPASGDFLLLQMPVTIDEVIIHLEKIIDWSKANNNAAGYFATLYHKVTCKVKECISKNEFEDGARMEKLDVTFANRYLTAFNFWISDKQNTSSWKTAFDSVSDNSSIVLQHLLLGMNAHINLDLGIVTVQVMKGLPLDDIKNDFNSINAILSAMTDNIEGCLTKINPLMKLLNLEIFNFDEMLVQFSITTARDGAWQFANELNGKANQDYENCIVARDERIVQLANSIAKPHGLILKVILKIIRLFEKKKVSKVIDFLGE
ncbi:MAG: DUF5995 family protein [Bacteroidota bacterium]|nr:DUF5995 family protein [Bacteroidota bacterium]